MLGLGLSQLEFLLGLILINPNERGVIRWDVICPKFARPIIILVT